MASKEYIDTINRYLTQIGKLDKMEEDQKQAYLYGGENAHEYAQSIGKSDLATFTADEWLSFCEVLSKNYHLKFIELTNK